MSSKLIWTRVDPDGPGLHCPARDGDCGWDLEAAHDVILNPFDQVDIDTNVRVQLPQDVWGEIRARSSIARLGLSVDAGVIDNAYTGTLLVLMRNMNYNGHHNTNCDEFGRVFIKKGWRIAQLVLHRAYWTDGLEIETLEHDPRRGEAGFGSTNTKETK